MSNGVTNAARTRPERVLLYRWVSTNWKVEMKLRLLGHLDEHAIGPKPRLRNLEQAILPQGTALGREASGRLKAAPPAPAEPAVLEGQKSAQDVRKTVTILFTDIVDSSRLSLARDPEALQNLLTRYFGEMSAVILRHGGIVERYIGEARAISQP